MTNSAGIVDVITTGLSQNPYFNAGAGLAGLGIAATVGRRVLIINFINKHSKHKARTISATSVIRQTESGKVTSSFYLLPGYGTHYFNYNYRWIQVERTREKHQFQRDGLRTALETVTLTTFGTSPLIWKDFLERATVEALQREETGLVVYSAVGPEWRRMGNPRRKRPIESVVLADGITEQVCKDVEEFINGGEWYVDRGIPYRRGYLLHGPPGTGKSSFISALAGHFGYSICILSLSERTLDDDRLAYLLNNTPPNAFVLLEDIDAAFVRRDLFENDQHRAYEGMTRVTFSGLLNAIDGVASSEERILFMTTNHLDHLDPALIRPGRIDVSLLFDNCTDEMMRKLLQKFYNDVPDEVCTRFVAEVRRRGLSLSPAEIQGHLLLNKNDPEAAISNIESSFKEKLTT